MASAETVVLTLQEQISGPAEAASGALSLLEQKILRDQTAIDRLQEVLGRARAKLAAIQEGGEGGFVDVAAYYKQEAAVNSLENRITGARMRIQAAIEGQAAKEAAAADAAAAAEQASAERKMAIAASAAAQAQAAAERKAAAEAAAADRAAAQAEAAAQRKVAAEEAAASKAAAAAERAAKKEIAAAKKSAEEQIKKSEEARRQQQQQNAAIVETGQKFLGLLGPVGEQANKFIELGKAIAKLPPQLQLVAVAVLVAVGAIAAVAKFFATGVEAAGQYRDELLRLQGAAGGSAEAAKELQAAVTAVSSASATSREKITDFAGQLARAGLQGAELKRALEAAAIASSAGGDQMANDFIKAAEAAKKTGGSVDELSKAMKDKLGGVAAAQALSFGVQIDKLKENLTGLFSGADITPLLEAMHALLSIFDQTSETGQAMREAIGGAIEFIIGAVLQLANLMLRAYIAIKGNAVAWAVVKAAALGVAVVFGLIAAVIGTVIAVIGGLAAAFAAVIGWIAAVVVNGISAIGTILSGILDAITAPFTAAKAWLSSFSLADIGSNMVTGLANGIAGAGGKILSALMGAVKGAWNAAASFLKLGSPSRLFKQMGAYTGEGMALGIDASADGVAESAEGLGSAAATGGKAGAKAAAAMAPAKGGAAPQGFAPTFSNCNFVGTTQREVEAMMRAVFEAEYLDAGAAA